MARRDSHEKAERNKRRKNIHESLKGIMFRLRSNISEILKSPPLPSESSTLWALNGFVEPTRARNLNIKCGNEAWKWMRKTLENSSHPKRISAEVEWAFRRLLVANYAEIMHAKPSAASSSDGKHFFHCWWFQILFECRVRVKMHLWMIHSMV